MKNRKQDHSPQRRSGVQDLRVPDALITLLEKSCPGISDNHFELVKGISLTLQQKNCNDLSLEKHIKRLSSAYKFDRHILRMQLKGLRSLLWKYNDGNVHKMEQHIIQDKQRFKSIILGQVKEFKENNSENLQ